MHVCLAPTLAVDDATRAFLQAAVDLDCPQAEVLSKHGIRRWDADRLLTRLKSSGEISETGWVEEARQAYQSLLQRCHSPDSRGTAQQSPAQEAHTPRKPSPFPQGEGPREKAWQLGIDALSDRELLALILRTGTSSMDVMALADALLDQYDGLVGLAGSDVLALANGHGLGQAKSAEIAAVFELGRRLLRSARRQRPRLHTPEAVFDVIGADLMALAHEEFLCLALDVRSRLIGEPRRLSKGDIDGTEAGPRLFYRHALCSGAASAIAVHNHPTGDPSPSAADLAVTRRLLSAGRTLDCPLVDHVIIGDGGRFISLRRDYPHLFAE
ncbi:MAG: DNA repair protein RadC [Planctomycetota bacterium]|nr:MAG: DNA repair protein RadC [Planctomycetota bacterium]